MGTSSAEEAREYFAEMDRHRVQFVYGGEEDDESIRLAFDKSRADDRKIWIAHTSVSSSLIIIICFRSARIAIRTKFGSCFYLQ